MINCYAITEKRNLAALAAHLEKHTLTKLVGHYAGAELNYAEIVEQSVHIIFIDQQLVAEFKNLLSKLRQHMSIVYLAENEGFAFQAFEDSVLDYIVYPISPDRLEKSINKLVRLSLLLPVAQHKPTPLSTVESFFVKPDPKSKVELLINCNDVLFIEAYQNDVAIQMMDGRRLVCFHTMKEMEDNLSNCFLRVHKSFIINYKRMSAFDGSNIIINSHQEFKIPLGGVYKKTFMDKRNHLLIRKQPKFLENEFLRKALAIPIAFLLTEINFLNDLLYV